MGDLRERQDVPTQITARAVFAYATVAATHAIVYSSVVNVINAHCEKTFSVVSKPCHAVVVDIDSNCRECARRHGVGVGDWCIACSTKQNNEARKIMQNEVSV